MKQCSVCKETKPQTEFYKRKNRSSGLHSECKPCFKARNESGFLKSKYGVSLVEKKQMTLDQEGKCSVCQKELDGGRNTCVDHCHVSGKVRGILCRKCNSLLGQAEDNIQTLQNAIQYLTTHNNN